MTFLQALKPDILSLLYAGRGMKSQEWAKAVFFALLGVAFWALIFAGVRYILKATLDIELLGEILARKVFSLVFITFFIFLLLSNIITAFSTYFLARDLNLLNHLPLNFDGFFASRFITSLMSSSWHIFVFGTPVIAAYGMVFNAGWFYYFASFAAMIPFTMIPAALSVVVSHILVSIFPAKKLRDYSFIMGIAIVAFVLVYIRMYIKPERFINPEGFQNFTNFIAALDIPQSFYFPPDWFVQLSYPLLQGLNPDSRFVMLLFSSAFFLYFSANQLSRVMYSYAYSRAQEGKPMRKARSFIINILADISALPYGAVQRAFIVKDIKLFMRDTAQWTQLLLIGSLVLIYIANAEHFRFIAATGIVGEREIFMLNILLIAFIVLSVAVRFVYPAVSMEGRSFWLVRVAPISPRRIVMGKFIVYFPPMLIMALLFTLLSFWIMRSPALHTSVAVAAIASMTFIATAMGVGMGAMFPRFDIDNVAKIPASLGGIVYMLLCGGVLMIVLTAIGVMFYLSTSPYFEFGSRMTRNHFWFFGAAATFVASIGMGGILPLFLGARSLARYE